MVSYFTKGWTCTWILALRETSFSPHSRASESYEGRLWHEIDFMHGYTKQEMDICGQSDGYRQVVHIGRQEGIQTGKGVYEGRQMGIDKWYT